MSNNSVYLVTGAMGCLGAWTLRHLVEQGKKTVSLDVSENRHRLNLRLAPQEQQAITFEQCDLREFEQVKSVFERHKITHVIHLAALQVPFCRADPVMGAQVNVVGTVNIFEAARQLEIGHVSQASSIAVYGPAESYPTGLIKHDAPFDPRTLYGVYKQATEGIGRIYWQDHQLSSITLRPYTVYGVGRDQGLTSEPTKAMLAAVQSKPYVINFGGRMQFQMASDVARYFILAAEKKIEGAMGYNLGGPLTSVEDVAKIIMGIRNDSKIEVEETQLPFPEGFDDTMLKQQLPMQETSLEDGIEQTMLHFEACLADGRLSPE